MSIQAMGWVLEWSASTLADRLVFLAIANHADARGMNAWPSIDKIAEEARVHRTTVFRAIDALEASGELTVLRRPGRSSYYGITQLMGSQPATGNGSQSATGQGSQDATGKGSQIATGGVASTHHRGSRLLPKPSLTVNEPANRPPTPTAPVAKPEPLDAATRARGAEFIRSLRSGK